MNFRTYAAASMLLVVFGFAVYAADTAVEDLKCPVSGQPVNPEAFVEHNGGKVYFCCENCPKKFSADPAKYAAKANHQMAQSGQLKQTACPITGKAAKDSTAIDVQGVSVAFCCNNCKGKVAKAEGDEQLELVFGDSNKGFKAAAE